MSMLNIQAEDCSYGQPRYGHCWDVVREIAVAERQDDWDAVPHANFTIELQGGCYAVTVKEWWTLPDKFGNTVDYRWYVSPELTGYWEDAIAFAEFAHARWQATGRFTAAGMELDDSLDFNGNQVY